MSIGVSTEFIDLTDGKWHLLPSNAINIVFEITEGVTEGVDPQPAHVSVDIETSHSGNVIHVIGNLHSSNSGNKDHLAVNEAIPGRGMVLQNVKAVNKTAGTILTHARVYFGRR